MIVNWASRWTRLRDGYWDCRSRWSGWRRRYRSLSGGKNPRALFVRFASWFLFWSVYSLFHLVVSVGKCCLCYAAITPLNMLIVHTTAHAAVLFKSCRDDGSPPPLSFLQKGNGHQKSPCRVCSHKGWFIFFCYYNTITVATWILVTLGDNFRFGAIFLHISVRIVYHGWRSSWSFS